MKKLILLLLAFTFVLLYSCKKKDSPADPTPFTYTSLAASDTVVNVNSIIHIVAVAGGDDLQYSWASTDMDGNNYGTIIGSGNDIQWSICHTARFRVTCTVSDKYSNSGSKSVFIDSKP
jgi:hypothetical protein